MTRFDWEHVCPKLVATRQKAWERGQTALRMRDLGLTFAEMARYLRVSNSRAQQIYNRAERRRGYISRFPPPVVEWMGLELTSIRRIDSGNRHDGS